MQDIRTPFPKNRPRRIHHLLFQFRHMQELWTHQRRFTEIIFTTMKKKVNEKNEFHALLILYKHSLLELKDAKCFVSDSQKDIQMMMRALRKEQGLSLRDVAKEAQISASFLQDIENGRRFPSDSVLNRIIETLSPPKSVE